MILPLISSNQAHCAWSSHEGCYYSMWGIVKLFDSTIVLIQLKSRWNGVPLRMKVSKKNWIELNILKLIIRVNLLIQLQLSWKGIAYKNAFVCMNVQTTTKLQRNVETSKHRCKTQKTPQTLTLQNIQIYKIWIEQTNVYNNLWMGKQLLNYEDNQHHAAHIQMVVKPKKRNWEQKESAEREVKFLEYKDNTNAKLAKGSRRSFLEPSL